MADEVEVSQPGLSELREAVETRFARLPSGGAIRDDAVAGLNSAVASVPDGMATGILAGVNPIYGLYACMVGPVAGGIFSSTQLMIVATTSAAALTAGQAIAGFSDEDRANALFLLVVLIGAFQIVFGLLRTGKLTRFVSFSVMTGFILGIAVLTVLSQVPTITGYDPVGSDNKVIQAANVLANFAEINLRAFAIAALTVLLATTLTRTRVGKIGSLLAIIIPSALVVVMGWDSVQIVRDVGEMPSSIPMPILPAFSLISVDLILAAASIAVIIVVQGTGVSQSVPNPDGSRRSISRDFIGQGAANIASGLFRGLPVGGSLGSTALNVTSGARSRWAAIFAGLWMMLLVVFAPRLVSYVAMPALGALLILASLSAIKPREMRSIWSTGWPSRLAVSVTFVATLFLPIQAAVGLGVLLSALLYVNESSTDVLIVELVKLPDGRIKEREPSEHVRSNAVTILDVYGHLFYAGARTLQQLLPTAEGAKKPVVILRLRGRDRLGATLIDVLADYANKLRDAGGRLYLTGLDDEAYGQAVQSEKLNAAGVVHMHEASPIRGESTNRAYADAAAWLAGQEKER